MQNSGRSALLYTPENAPELIGVLSKAAFVIGMRLHSIIFASSFGPGVMFSAIPLTLYQGGIAALSGVLAPFLTDALINEMSAVGSVLIIAIGLNMMNLPKERIRVGNLLPAIFIPCIYFPVAALLANLF